MRLLRILNNCQEFVMTPARYSDFHHTYKKIPAKETVAQGLTTNRLLGPGADHLASTTLDTSANQRHRQSLLYAHLQNTNCTPRDAPTWMARRCLPIRVRTWSCIRPPQSSHDVEHEIPTGLRWDRCRHSTVSLRRTSFIAAMTLETAQKHGTEPMQTEI